MNDNIKRLCEELLHYEDMIFGWENTVNRAAEAIARECARVAIATPCPITDKVNLQSQGHTWDMACIAGSMKIKEHFGVTK